MAGKALEGLGLSADDSESREKAKIHIEAEKVALEKEKIALEREKVAHSRWWQEDTLVHHRLTWLLQSQVFLFAGYGLLSRTGGADPAKDGVPEKVSDLIRLLPWIGLAVCGVITIGIAAAWRAQEVLALEYRLRNITVGVRESTSQAGRVPSYLLPLVFSVGWGWLQSKKDGAVTFFCIEILVLISVFIFVQIPAWKESIRVRRKGKRIPARIGSGQERTTAPTG